jgi:tight adherence protein B
MTGLVLGLLALAALLSPRPSLAVARLRGCARPRPTGRRRRRRRRPASPARRHVAVPALGCGTASVGAAQLAGGAPALPALAGLLAGGTAGLLVSKAAVRRQRQREYAAAVEYVAALAADVRAGQQPAEALARATAAPDLDSTFLSPALEAVWAVSARSGAPVATVLDRMEQDLRARVRQRREVAAQLAGARATAALLAFLPVLGIGLGAAMGARPLEVLLAAPAGQLALVIGVGLDAAGVLWTSRIVGRAGGDR